MAYIDFTDSIYDAQQGSQSAIKFIYDNTIQLFYKEANAFMRDKNEADRAIRDAYVFIFEHLDSLEDTSKFLLWANEVCKNTCISRLIEAGVFNGRVPAEAVNLGDISPAAEFDSQINLSASMSPDYIQECLEAVLGSLPDDQRACAVLWGEGYPLNSISRKLGISPVAVNYTLAYTLGNITNSVNTLSANGLPLFAMEPIPYFLWLLMCYYQYYQPGEAVPGALSSFSGVLRRLMPDEASVYSGEYMTEEPEQTDGKVQHVTSVENAVPPAGNATDTDFADFVGDELDLDDFIRDLSDEVEDEDDGLPEAGTENAPPMDVISPHKEDELSGGASGGDGSDGNPAGEGAEAADGSDENGKKAAAAAGGTGRSAELDRVFSDIKSGESSDDDGSKKKHTGLIIFLIVLAVILCLIAAMCIFYREKVNELLGINLFPTTQTATEPETTTEEPTTPEPETTTPEPETTTPEPETTTPEPETTTPEPTTEEDPGPEYDVQIYAEGYSLSMKDAPNGEGLLYIPADEVVHIYETQDGWGHTYYDGMEGWIWLNYTKVAGKARVVQPTDLLDPPRTYVMKDTEFGNELRTGPSNQTSTFGPIPAGTELSLEGYYIDDYSGALWVYTSYNGQHGWVFLYYYEPEEELE